MCYLTSRASGSTLRDFSTKKNLCSTWKLTTICNYIDFGIKRVLSLYHSAVVPYCLEVNYVKSGSGSRWNHELIIYFMFNSFMWHIVLRWNVFECMYCLILNKFEFNAFELNKTNKEKETKMMCQVFWWIQNSSNDYFSRVEVLCDQWTYKWLT